MEADIGSAGEAAGPARRAPAAEPDSWRAGVLTILRPIQVPAWLERLAVPLVLLWRRLRYGYAFRRIPLTQGLYALVDPEDYARLARHKWHATRGRTTFYAQRKVWDPVTRSEVTIKMHRQILRIGDGLFVDHVSRNGLDNRKANLRSATPAQNACNRARAGRSGGHSAYRGVTWHKAMRQWFARIGVKGRTIPLGYFDDEIDAALAYDEAARRHHGPFATLNFPEGPPHKGRRS